MSRDPKTSSDEHDAGSETYEGGRGDDGDGDDHADDAAPPPSSEDDD